MFPDGIDFLNVGSSGQKAGGGFLLVAE
jgi:hypothetical protein